MLFLHVRLFQHELKKYFLSKGLIIERDDDKYLVFRADNHCVIHPKMKTNLFLTIFIVEYDEHIVKKVNYSGMYLRDAMKKIVRAYKKYLKKWD